MDSKKVDKIMPFTFAYMEDINVLVSDDSLEGEIVREAKRRDVQIV